MQRKQTHDLTRVVVLAMACAVAGFGCSRESLVDDAGGRSTAAFPEITTDVFQAMDGGIALSADEIKGRNTWNLWAGGNEQFWDRMACESFGLMDLLKTLDSRRRGSRFKDVGLINEPGFRMATKPDEFGLYLDERVEPAPAGIDESAYGRSSGVLGFRLFPNPKFDADARKKWDANKFYNDADYAVDAKLVRPYRVGVTCGSCHIAFHPLNPPGNPEEPKWENLSSIIGNQYIREGRVFAHNVREGGLFWEMLKNQPPGTSDTSRIATDHINNPNMINAIFDLNARLTMASEEKMAGDTLNIPGETTAMKVPHVLKDGADSVGVPGATIRVYVNIGMYSQHWLQQHNPLIGLGGQKPFSVKTAQENSVYWRATEEKIANIAKFFQRSKPLLLKDAPGGARYLTTDATQLTRGKIVFAENCATCHSSKRPPAGTADPEAWFREEVVKIDFLTDNFLSDDKPHPVTKIKTNAGRALGTNATRGHIWDTFSSETYKTRDAVGDIEVFNPYTERMEKFKAPGGGRGYYRTPSLISIWTSAPFLHNNALGLYNGDPSVAGRMAAFDDAIGLLLWPQRRKDEIWRTTRECDLQLQEAVIPKALRILLRSQIDADGYLRLGPIPEGTPINLLTNISPDQSPKDMVGLIMRIKLALAKIKLGNLDAAAAKALMKEDVAPELFKASKCPDLIVNKGHTFGEELPDDDKRALIEFLKTM
ncbi:MAG: hypothetical protein ACKVX7_11745 [Planctomycetota bacterium]